MDKVKQYKDKIDQLLKKYNRKTKITFVIGVLGILAAAIIAATLLNRTSYTVLYTDITQDEANEIIGKLGEIGVGYRYDNNGTIRVDKGKADQARADLAAEGYPKNGFSYDIFTENAGGMTTDSEKQTYKLYELQNRIGATIRLFDGVKDAKVTIALSEEKKYVLSEEDEEENSSASVVVTMKDSGAPSDKQASAMQRLVAKSVPGMQMENVAVFDGNGIEVTTNSGSGGTSGNAAEEIARLIESQLTQKVLNVLGPFYGSENIRVSARGKVDMEKVIRESTTYETPEKINQDDKTGIVASESTTKDTSSAGGTAQGVTGTEANADQSEYNANTTTEGTGTSLSESATRDYLVNQIKEQGEIDPGVLKDMTVSIAINSESLNDLNMNQLRDLVGNATGITTEERQSKITIVSAPFYQEEKKETVNTVKLVEQLKAKWPIFGIAGGGLLLLIIILIIIRKIRKKKHPIDEEFEKFVMPETAVNPDLLNMKNEKSRELRENVRGFVDENPEISAQMIKNWLNGGTQDGGNASE
ncbi:flagellar M-ring protein FliF [Aequitasia blattaphilus]|uniref:Flagellar M-ring protein n=1 Tax=Aequitasia blattaphilus TaxID=2949332 RepID=A0ABT1E9K5_9FIRM|nr:flagellar basal-body MS-ring/collar protein FliF [Aequitasia blattaphilus]MCP1102503.1 flagellar M-ring protein FliF [Aequitasia blattaphilus]MCR8615143.1 flagellar M-ring protein FliF [Aequitasia blattaphilus]